jgi:hypothetical protein
MARNQKNYQNFLYVDDNGVSWTKRGEDGGAAALVDDHAPATGAPVWRDSPRMRVRKIIFQDPVTFRTVLPIFYTSSAYNLVAIGDIVAVQVAGLATTVNYNAVKKLGEKQPSRQPARQLNDT